MILFMTTGRLTIPHYVKKKKKKDEVNRETEDCHRYCKTEDVSSVLGHEERSKVNANGGWGGQVEKTAMCQI